MENRQALLNAQLGVIGSMLIDDRTVGIALQALKPEYFDGPYRTIFEAMRGLFQRGRPVDPVTVVGVIGKDYTDLLRQIMDLTPTAAHVKAYIADLKRQARLRLMQEAAAEILSAETEDDIRAMLDRINAVMVDRPGVRAMTMQAALADFYKRHDPSVKPTYLPWRFEKLNDHLRTMRGDFGIIGGYPSDGKTTLALATAREQARTKKVGFFSFETDCEKLADAMISAAAQIGLPKIQMNAMNANDWDTLAAISGDFGGRNLDIIEAAGMTVGDIRLYSMAKHYDVIYIDYLQLIESSDKTPWGNQEYARVTAVSRALKQFGRQGGPTIIALSQLGRPEPNKKTGKIPPPTMSSLRSSGQIEQDADFILLLFRENQKIVDCDRVVTVAKNKTGIAGNSFYLRFNGETQTFMESRRDWTPPKTPAEEVSPLDFTELPGDCPVPF